MIRCLKRTLQCVLLCGVVLFLGGTTARAVEYDYTSSSWYAVGGDSYGYASVSVLGESTVITPISTNSVYEFNHWEVYKQGFVDPDIRYNSPLRIRNAEGVILLQINVKFSKKSYTVTFDKRGGSGGTDSASATYDDPMPTITKPSKTGYAFTGYFDRENGAGTKYYNADVTSAHNWDKTSSATLYAYWTGAPVTITYDGNGGTPATQTKGGTFDSSYPADVTTPTWTGQTFLGWFTQSEGGTQIYPGTTKITRADAHKIYAHWSASPVTITYDGNGGTPATQTKGGTFDSSYPADVTTPTWTGQTFLGWFTQSEGGTQIYPGTTKITRADAHKIYAHWSEDWVTLTIKLGEGVKEASYSNETTKGWIKYESDLPLSFLSGTWVNIAGTAEPGYKSDYTKSNPYSLQIVCDINVYLTATARDYIVELNPNGGECDESFITCRQGQEVGELPLPAREGHTFKGWRAEDNSIVDPETPYDSATMGLTFTADWVTNKYLLATSVNDSTLGSVLRYPEKNTYYFGTKVDLFAIPQRGAAFKEWSDGLLTTNRIVTIGINNTYTANFSNLLFTISFDGNGAKEGSMVPQVAEGTNWLTLAANKYIYPGRTFHRWCDDVVPESLISDGAAFDPNLTNHLLSAVWSTNTYTIVFNGNHYRASGTMADMTNLCDIANELPTNCFVRPAADFLGWATNSTAIIPDFTNCALVVNLSLIDGDTVPLYAVWAVQTNDLTVAAHAVNVKLMTTESTQFKKWVPADNGECGIRSGTSDGSCLEEGWHSSLAATILGKGILSFRWRLDSLESVQCFHFNVSTNIYSGPTNSNWQSASYFMDATGSTVSVSWVAGDENNTTKGSMYLDDVRWIPFQETEYDWARTYHPKGESATDAECNAFLYNNWSKYVAGCDPTDSNSVFRVKSFTLTNGVVNLEWEPDLSDFTPPRDYLIFGKTNITDAAWHSPTNSESRFFKVEVEMR